MELKQQIVITYNSDPTKMIDDHESEIEYLTEINNRIFTDVYEALIFLTQCTQPITTIEDIIPVEKNKKYKNFKLVLPDRNIKIKHQACNNLDTTVLNDDPLWDRAFGELVE